TRAMLDRCQEAGIPCMVVDGRIRTDLPLLPNWRETLAQVVRDYADHPALYAYYVRDEPNYRDFRNLGQICRALHQLDPNHFAYVNLFPTYANERQLGTPTYEDHVAKFLDIVRPRVLSYDHYCLMKNGTDRPDFYENLEIVRRQSLRAGVPFWNIVLSTPHLAYRDPREGELRWQAYASLVYGAKGILYFTYWALSNDPAYRNAILDSEGKRTQHYGWIQHINAEIRALGKVMLNLKSTAVYHTGTIPQGCARLGGDSPIRPDGAPEAVFGFFEDERARPYVMVFNKDHDAPAQVRVKIPHYVKAVYEISKATGEEQAVTLDEGDARVLVASLRPGDGNLYRLDSRFAYPEPPEIVEEINFDFTKAADALGWTATHSLSTLTVADGALRTRVTGADPYMTRLGLRIPPDKYSKIVVRMAKTAGGEGQLFWITADSPRWADDKYVNFAAPGDGEMHECVINVGEHRLWRGQTIVGIRLDPDVGAPAGTTVAIESVRGR
ncbi:MAG: hypothetical protein ACE5O2_06395, partial [Armatimonadota bacterium]